MGIDNDIHINGLHVQIPTSYGAVKAVDDINIKFEHKSFTAIIGESGCGKSVLGQAILGILPEYVGKLGEILYHGQNVLNNAENIDGFYGKDFGIVPQHPGEALNPFRKIGKQMQDVLNVVNIVDSDNTYKKACLKIFGLNDVERILKMYPHELSGGMQQRVLCAMGISCNPKWILADEPTKGLDGEVCKTVYHNLLCIKKRQQHGMIIITHDINLARYVCDYVAVMYAGQILEFGKDIFNFPKHPYTKAFLKSLPENGFQSMIGKAPMPGEHLYGCRFAKRCLYCQKQCLEELPAMYDVDNTKVRCFLYASSN